MWSIKHIGRKNAGVPEQDNLKWLPPNMEWTILNNPSYIEGFMPLQPKKLDSAHGASKLYNLPGFLDSDKTMQLLLRAIVLYSSLPTLPQSTYNRRLAKNTSYLLCVTITILVTIICISVCNDLPNRKSYLLTIIILITTYTQNNSSSLRF